MAIFKMEKSVTILPIAANFGMMTPFDHLHRIAVILQTEQKSYRIIILADRNRKEPKQKIYTNIILGNSSL